MKQNTIKSEKKTKLSWNSFLQRLLILISLFIGIYLAFKGTKNGAIHEMKKDMVGFVSQSQVGKYVAKASRDALHGGLVCLDSIQRGAIKTLKVIEKKSQVLAAKMKNFAKKGNEKLRNQANNTIRDFPVYKKKIIEIFKRSKIVLGEFFRFAMFYSSFIAEESIEIARKVKKETILYLNTLRERTRHLFVMKFLHSLSTEEIDKVLKEMDNKREQPQKLQHTGVSQELEEYEQKALQKYLKESKQFDERAVISRETLLEDKKKNSSQKTSISKQKSNGNESTGKSSIQENIKTSEEIDLEPIKIKKVAPEKRNQDGEVGCGLKEVFRKKLGNGTWFLLHTISLDYPEKPTLDDKLNMMNFLALLRKVFPCEECRGHFTRMIEENPPEIGSRAEFIDYVHRIHNIVNKRLGKPLFERERIDKEYGCGC